MAVLLPKPMLRPQARVVSTIKFKQSYMGFHTPPLGEKLTPESVTEGTVLGFDDKRDAVQMAAKLVAHRRSAQEWPNRIVDPDQGFWLFASGAAGTMLDIGELQIVDEPLQAFRDYLALNGIALRTISRDCSKGALHTVVHKQHVDVYDRQRHLKKLLAKSCPEHF